MKGSKQQLLFHQQGAVLIVSLMLLVILTMLGISTMESTKLQTRMAANMVEYNYAFQVGEVGIEIPRNYNDADVQNMIDSKNNVPVALVSGVNIDRETIGGKKVKSRVDHVTTTAELPSALQDISGSGDCGSNSGCKIMFFITKSVGTSDSERQNAPTVTLYGGLRKKVVDEAASGVFREP
ncbi:pilus assembly PilX N-terminal domain-containing protein [Candidatus Albibeggiatoa sp. nov. NOAA]|uniref:pilus assembly PilX family protein n=1 Tax=Candidatus Albibeggiatoa sp. nov. NOAA TaxID=3162724 RepID=UPI0032FCD6D3|nr:pilus assembly PilX N-terminal domain-containing protein [Thiotrichaceae bacterium]